MATEKTLDGKLHAGTPHVVHSQRYGGVFAAIVSLAAFCATAFEYTVTRPTICPRWSGAAVGEWTMDREAAFAKAKAEYAYTIVLFTGSWWCPICQTCESKVLTSQAWADYVAKEGYYLVEYDYPYRFPVPEGQEWKGTSPLGDGWGFQCWLYDADYLAQGGLTAEDGLAAIQKMYDYQDALALPGSTVDVIGRLGGGTMDLHKIAYPSMVLFRPDGSEVGRLEFPRPWYQASAVSDEDAINFIIGGLEFLRIEDECGLFENPTEGGLLGTEAMQYQGWIADRDTGNVVGTVVLKSAKANRKTGLSKLTATITMQNGAKVKLTGTAETPSTNKVFTLKSASGSASVKLGANGLVGFYTVPEGKVYSIQGARDVFKAKDAAAKAAAGTVATGTWPVALFTEDDGGSDFARGVSALSATVDKKGKVKIVGTLGDGTKANAKAQAVVGENGVVCVPVVASLYSKKGGYSLLLTFNGGKLAAVSNMSPWKANKNPATFTAKWKDAVKFAAVPGEVPFATDMTLSITGFDAVTSIDGCTVDINPNASTVSASGSKWTGPKGITDLKVTYKGKTLEFKGALNVYVTDANGKAKKIKGTLTGVVVEGVPYGTLFIKNVGTWAVEFASGCGGGC